jgi:hypothetical protein
MSTLLKANIGNDAIFYINNNTSISGIIIDVIICEKNIKSNLFGNNKDDIKQVLDSMVIVENKNNETEIFYSDDIKNFTIKDKNIKLC